MSPKGMNLKVKNKRNIIIGALLIIIALMTVGYSAFATQLNINGTAEIVGEWDVRITNIVAQEVSEGCDAGTPEYTNTTATFDAKLQKPGDVVSYVITIENKGTIDAKLDSITFTPDEENGSPAIIYTNTSPSDTLNAGSETTLTVTAKYDEKAETIPEIKTKQITGVIEYVQK